MMPQGFCDSSPDDKVSYKYYYKKIEKLNISFVKLEEKKCERSPLQDKHLEEIHGLNKRRNSWFEACKKQTFHVCASYKEFEKPYYSSKWSMTKIPRRWRRKIGWWWAVGFSRYTESHHVAQNSRAESSCVLEAYCIAQWNICSNWRIYEGNGGELHELTRG